MPWYDFACVDWNDCVWEDWADCEWDKFSIVYQDAKTRTMRKPPPEGIGNFRRPYLEGNPSYAEDNQKYSDVAVANARIKAKDEVRPHMTFKQPYRYDEFQKMKYRDEPPNDRLVKTPMDILAEAVEKEKEYEWQWLRYLDDKRWTPSIGEWFDNRWLSAGGIGAVWVAHLDDDDWEGLGYAVWETDRWHVSNFGGTDTDALLHVKHGSSWASSYRPTKIRVTLDVNSITVVSPPGGAIKLEDSVGTTVFSQDTYASLGEISFTLTNDIHRLYIREYPSARDIYILNIEFCEDEGAASGLDLSVVSGSWWKDLRPRKFRMMFDEATANVSLRDTNGVELYANATYASGTEVYLTFAGADIARIVVTGSGDVTDIEFQQQVEKGSTLGSDKRAPRKEGNAELGRTLLPDPNPIKTSKRLPRRTDLRTMR